MAYYEPEQRLDFLLSHIDDKNYIKSSVRVFLYHNEYIKTDKTVINWIPNTNKVLIKLFIGGNTDSEGSYQAMNVSLINLVGKFTYKNTVSTFRTAIKTDLKLNTYNVRTEVYKGADLKSYVTNLIGEDEDIEVEG